jgi:hypothetical protein
LNALRKVAGSALAASVGLIVGAIAMRALAWADWWPSIVLVAYFVVPVWLVLLLPLYVFVPRTSRLWSPGYCSVFGALSGALIISAFFWLGGGVGFPLFGIFLFIAILVGASTCLFGAMTAPYFYGTQKV